jgi:hypothetical protein
MDFEHEETAATKKKAVKAIKDSLAFIILLFFRKDTFFCQMSNKKGATLSDHTFLDFNLRRDFTTPPQSQHR